MKTLFNRSSRTITAAFAAIVIVGLSGLTLDRGHAGALPAGVIEIGELETVMVGEMAIAALPAVEVIGARSVQLADIAADADTQG
ncbi:MAG: hypothetical protein ACREVI_03400 [Steroidobacteraceae bacterium]